MYRARPLVRTSRVSGVLVSKTGIAAGPGAGETVPALAGLAGCPLRGRPTGWRWRQMGGVLLLLDKPKAEQDDTERDNNDAGAIHDKLTGGLRDDSEF